MLSARTLRAPARHTLRSTAPSVPKARLNPSDARYQSTNSNASSSSGSHLATGLASGIAAALVSYGLYTLTPAGRVQRRINKTAYEADRTYKDAAAKLQQSTPNTQQAVDTLRETAYSYAAFIPGGRAYVDTIFNDIDTLRKDHGGEVDRIVSDTYKELQEVSRQQLSTDTLWKALDVLKRFSEKMGHVAASGLSDLANNHPQLKEKVGPGADRLKQLGDQLGPEAKKQVDETWNQASKILQEGFNVQNLNQIRQLIQEKIQKVQELGDRAWSEGLEQAKPILENNPKIKQLVEENANVLKQGNASQLFQKVKDASQSGNFDDLQNYVSSTVSKLKQTTGESSTIESYLKTIPGGLEILPKLHIISQLNEQHTDEAKQLLNETIDQLKNVLNRQSQKAEELVHQAKH